MGYTGMEAKFFCMLIIAFLYIFRTKSFQFQYSENKLLYLFAFAQILFSVFGDIAKTELVKNIFFAVCGISGYLAMEFCLEYAFKMADRKVTTLKKVLLPIIGIAVGILTFYSFKSGINAIAFAFAFIIIVLFVTEQYNKIRVDNLTRLYNRYGMDVELRQQLKQYEREHSDSFYIISCDLDNFKYINDTWGHKEGDRALVLVAGVLARVGKIFDAAVFRIGGDEFVLITDKSEKELADFVIGAIKTGLDNIDFRDDFDIKMSIGVALYDGVTSIDELLNNADKKMYEAKNKNKK